MKSEAHKWLEESLSKIETYEKKPPSKRTTKR